MNFIVLSVWATYKLKPMKTWKLNGSPEQKSGPMFLLLTAG